MSEAFDGASGAGDLTYGVDLKRQQQGAKIAEF